MKKAISNFCGHPTTTSSVSEWARDCSFDSRTIENSESESEVSIAFCRLGLAIFRGDRSVKGTTRRVKINVVDKIVGYLIFINIYIFEIKMPQW